MYRNDYGNLIARWKVECIEWRAKRLGFREDEIPDLEQVIVPELLKANFSPEGPASEKTFICRIVDHRLQAVLRDRSRVLRGGDTKTEPVDVLLEHPCPGMPEIERLCLHRDLEVVMAGLTPTERAVFEGLAAGSRLVEIANDTEKAKSTISKAMRCIRKKMRDRGIDAYLENN